MNAIRFSIEPTDRFSRFEITGPIEQMQAALDGSPQLAAQKLVNKGKVDSRTESENGELLTWALNARVLGNIQRKRAAVLQGVNKFISNLVQQRPQYEGPLNLTAYKPTMSEFDFIADVQRPAGVTDQAVRDRCVTAMTHMAADLRYAKRHPKESEVDSIRACINSATQYDQEGIMMTLTGHSKVQTLHGDWNPRNSWVELVGSSVQPGEQPLIYLAGAVAIANAGSDT